VLAQGSTCGLKCVPGSLRLARLSLLPPQQYNTASCAASGLGTLNGSVDGSRSDARAWLASTRNRLKNPFSTSLPCNTDQNSLSVEVPKMLIAGHWIWVS